MPCQYTVKSGDSLWKIAQAHGVTLGELLKANPQFSQDGRNPDLIYPGENVIIPNSSDFDNSTNVATGQSQCQKYTEDRPSYNPDLWNSEPIRTSTNCYAYAANDPYGHPYGNMPQPGIECGNPYSALTCTSVSNAAICDGMISAANPPPKRPGYYSVALVVDPGIDYHWYRLDSNLSLIHI